VGSLSFGPKFLMILMTLVGSFMVFTGIMLHSLSKLINHSIKKMDDSGSSNNVIVHEGQLVSKDFRGSGKAIEDH